MLRILNMVPGPPLCERRSPHQSLEESPLAKKTKKRIIISSAGRSVINPKDPKAMMQKIDATTPTRGSSIQGERQAAKGGPAGANQGGASRGSSRLEPSHVKKTIKRTQGK